MTGFIEDEDLPVVYSMASLLLFPSLAEGFGFPVLEAMSCGTPVVAGDIAALQEVGGDAVRLAAPDDLPDLREAIEDVLCDEERRGRMRERGRERARRFTWRAYAENLLALYHEVMQEDRLRHDAPGP